MLPWAAEFYKHRVETHGYDRPMTYCMPHGVPDNMTVAGLPFKIMQTPRATVVLFEEFHEYRQIHTDGGQLPVDPDPAWYGYSIGRWEGERSSSRPPALKECWRQQQGRQLARQQRSSAHRRAATYRAVPPDELRAHGNAGDRQRPEGIHTPLDVGHAALHAAARHRTARASLREQQGPREPAAVLEGTGAGQSSTRGKQ